MKIGTVRTEEARAYDSHAGYHQFHAEDTQEPYGSFEVFWHDGERPIFLDYCVGVQPGWYWWACFPGCMPCGEPAGPFAYSQQAHEDADEWSPDYDEAM
jgi:hypothetical protein